MELGLGTTPAKVEGCGRKPGAWRSAGGSSWRRRGVQCRPAVRGRECKDCPGARYEHKHTGRQGITGLKAATTPTATRPKATASFRTVTGTASSSEMLAAIRFEFLGS